MTTDISTTLPVSDGAPGAGAQPRSRRAVPPASMTRAAIEWAFSGEHGDEREGPDAYHREVDTR